MASLLKSIVFYDADGETRDFTFSFPYLDRDHVKVYIDDAPYGDFVWMGAYALRFNTALAKGKIKLKRETPRDTPLVTIADGSSLRAVDLNRAALQALFVAQEADDIAVHIRSGVIIAPESDAGRVTLTLPSIEARRNMVMGFDNNGGFRIYTEADMPKGPVGDQGPQGDQGPLGPVGIQGPQGATGETGDRGPIGLQGPEGIVGPQGDQGPRGVEGIQGPVGIVGPQGPQGPEGPIGPSFEPDAFGLTVDRATYNTQPVGFSFLNVAEGKIYFKLSATSGDWSTGVAFGQGPQGLQGPQGVQGVVGPKGDIGPQGPVGPLGPQGVVGPVGPIGPTGSTGSTGPQGVQGVVGPTGSQGIQGPEGSPGMYWRGTYSSTVQYIYRDTVYYNGESFIHHSTTPTTGQAPSVATYWSKIVSTGPAGPTGPVGPTGPQGPAGVKGNTGLTGPTGATGPAGPKGSQGIQGIPGSFDIYTGSSAAATTFPIGHLIAADGTYIDRNASVPIYIYTGNAKNYTLGAGGAQLAGTWRCRGATDGGDDKCLYQRVA